MITAKRVVGLFNYRKECRKLVEVWRVDFDNHKHVMRFVEVRVVGRFDYRKACRKLVEVRIVRFDMRKLCCSLVEVRRVLLTSAKRVAAL